MLQSPLIDKWVVFWDHPFWCPEPWKVQTGETISECRYYIGVISYSTSPYIYYVYIPWFWILILSSYHYVNVHFAHFWVLSVALFLFFSLANQVVKSLDITNPILPFTTIVFLCLQDNSLISDSSNFLIHGMTETNILMVVYISKCSFSTFI